MPAHLRSASSSPSKPRVPETPMNALPPNEALKQFILPAKTSSASRFLLLEHPRDQKKQRFFLCPEQGLFEFTKIASPPANPTSALFEPCGADVHPSSGVEIRKSDESVDLGYVKKDAEIFVASPFDLAFVLLPLLAPKQKGTRTLFQPLDDLLEESIKRDRHIRYILQYARPLTEMAAERFCDTIEAGDEKMYRFSMQKTLQDLVGRAVSIVTTGLPSTLEEKFVTRLLERPILFVKREETLAATITTTDSEVSEVSESFESQSTAVGSVSSTDVSQVSVTSSAATSTEDVVPPEVIRLQRLRVALDFMTASYLPGEVANKINEMLDDEQSPIDFTSLKDWMKDIARLQSEALVANSFSDFSRKRGHIEDDEDAEVRAEKKRKQAEEDKRKKAGESRGLRELKKVNTAGMKKMSDFFAKKPALKATS